MCRASGSAGTGCVVSDNRPLVLLSDETLLDELLRLAAAAGCELERVPDAAGVRPRWASAPLVLLDSDGARTCRDARLPRRERIVVLSREPADIELFRCAVALGAERVTPLPTADPWLTDALADAAEGPGAAPGRVVAVIGGRGGAGASVFTVAIGLAAARSGRRALLVDCDPLAGGLDLVLGAESEKGLRWPEMRVKSGRVAASSLHAALPAVNHGKAHLTLLSGARQGYAPEPDAVRAVVQAGKRAGEIVACDLPRHLPESACAALELADLTVVVVPAEVRACSAAARLADELRRHGATARVVVRGPTPGGLGAEEVAEAVGLPLLTWMPAQRGLALALENGRFAERRGPLAAAARKVLAALSIEQELRQVAS